jgi:hypothetical protein
MREEPRENEGHAMGDTAVPKDPISAAEPTALSDADLAHVAGGAINQIPGLENVPGGVVKPKPKPPIGVPGQQL